MVRRLLPLLALASAACASSPEQRPDPPAARAEEPPPAHPEEWTAFPARRGDESRGVALARWAEGLTGLPSLAAVSGTVPDECTGFVRLAYRQAGVELLGPESLSTDNGVTAIYRHARARGALHWRVPRPGDIVFFVETYDRNRDGRRNDGLTHVALVDRTEPDGTVVLLHRVSGGVKESRMNLRHPGEVAGPRGERWNDVLRGATRKGRAYLTGELFAAYASAERLLEPELRASR